MVGEVAYHFFDLPIHHLRLPVRLGMMSRRRTNFDLEDVCEGFLKLEENNGVTVADHIFGTAVTQIHVLVGEGGNGSSRTVLFCSRQADHLRVEIQEGIDNVITAGRRR